MGRSEKRARKKEYRDQIAAERRAALMRRRMIRGGFAGAVVVAVIFAALASGGENETTGDGRSPTPEATPSAPAVACGAQAPPPADPKQFKKEPQMTLKDGVDYRAVVHTSCGDIEIDLLEDKAPVTVNNFVFLARDGYFEGTIWHRIERNFVIQGGDPNGLNGTPPDGPGYEIKDELPEKAAEYVYGTLAMANSGPNTGGSQFFIVVHKGPEARKRDPLKEPAGLQPLYAIFGRVLPSSYAVVDEIAKQETIGGTDPVEAVKPVSTVYVESIEIIEQ